MASAQQRGGGLGGSPRNITGVVAIAALLGGGLALNNALFNVDGGHRAIKYTRIGGVQQKIYPEGTETPKDPILHGGY